MSNWANPPADDRAGLEAILHWNSRSAWYLASRACVYARLWLIFDLTDRRSPDQPSRMSLALNLDQLQGSSHALDATRRSANNPPARRPDGARSRRPTRRCQQPHRACRPERSRQVNPAPNPRRQRSPDTGTVRHFGTVGYLPQFADDDRRRFVGERSHLNASAWRPPAAPLTDARRRWQRVSSRRSSQVSTIPALEHWLGLGGADVEARLGAAVADFLGCATREPRGAAKVPAMRTGGLRPDRFRCAPLGALAERAARGDAANTPELFR